MLKHKDITTDMMDGLCDDGYWCVVCGRFLEAEYGVIVHDNVPHPKDMTFDDEDKPQ